MIRHVKDDLYQISQYVSGDYGSEAIHVYVLLNGGRAVLIDCGSHLHRASIMAALDEVLDGATPEYLLLTHSELPHAGNIAQVSEKWPDIKVIVSNVMLPYIEVLPTVPLENVTQVVPGTVIDFPNRQIHCLTALLKDQPGSHWLYDTATETLFTGDGFGYYHSAENRNKFSDELPNGVQIEQFAAYHKTAFRFLEWIKPERFARDLDTMFGNRPISTIAPIHGSAIRNDLDTHVARLKSAIVAVHDSYK